MPVFVARSMTRPVSMARNGRFAVLRLGQGIAEPGRVGEVHQQRRLGQGGEQFLAEQILVADVRRDSLAAASSGSWCGGPAVKSDIGMRAKRKNQAKPGGAYSPKGTRWRLA
jgi:hypothetical protein